MSSEEIKPGDLRRAEALVGRIRGVSTCRILTGDGGAISEIHVVASGGKSPKLVARDVESCLKATMGLEVDYRKIGVVVVDLPESSEQSGLAPASGDADGRGGESTPAVTPTEPPARASADDASRPAPADLVEEFPIEEHASRFAFVSVDVFAARDELRAEVELSLDGALAFGIGSTPNTSGEAWESVANATLRAVSEFLDEGTRLCLGDLQKIQLADRNAFVVRVDLIEARATRSLAGCALVSGNLNQSVVFATLDAVNRVAGRLDFRSSIEYRIR